MFSPAQNNGPAPGTLRSSRRRQRPLSNEGSLGQPKAKRQRSALSEKTFLPPDAEGAAEMEEVKSHKSPAIRNSNVRDVSGPQKDIVVRGRKSRSGDGGNKGDGSVVLTTNDTYTVSKLPALPDRLRADITSHQHGAIFSDTGYALTLTHTHAIIWPYAVNMPSPETFTFALPNTAKHVKDPLPLGSLVSASASSRDPGIVVIMPMTGNITYWESISSAATLDLKLQRNGVELVIPGTMSGETVIQILNAETAGFVLAFSSGRIAYMSVRDGQGRPAISVQFLRSGSGNGGIFGSLRNVLSSSSWRGDIAAVRAGKAEKIGERKVVVATAKAKLQAWNVHRGGHYNLDAEAEGREDIVVAIKEAVPTLSNMLIESFELLDFTFMPKLIKGSELGGQDENENHLLLLTSLTDRECAHYCLVQVTLKPDGLTIGNIRPIKVYKTPASRISVSKVRLYLPNPALVAYAVFDRAVVIISMAKPPDSPDLQLRNENNLVPQKFEDVIDLREDINVEIVGSGMEEPHGQLQTAEDSKSRKQKARHPAAVLIVRGGGVIRIAATDISKLASSKAQQVTARSKLEQAVFFGNLDRTPLSFAVRPELQFSVEEVGAAALGLSFDILKSETAYIPAVPASIEQNLRKRSAALRDMAEYLRSSGVELDRSTKWKLLCNAEKMAAATLIWKRYDARVRAKPDGKKRGLLTEVVEFIHEEYKTETVPEAGELDRVRHWFINDLWNLEVAIPWAYQVIKYTYQDGQKDHESVVEVLSEANDLVISALQGAFDFRDTNIELYGLQSEGIEHGILKTDHHGLPEFWTSTIYITENVRKQAELAGLLVKEFWDRPEAERELRLLSKVRMEHSLLIDVAIRSNRERIQWDAAQESSGLQIEGEQINVAQTAAQDDQIKLLATNLGLADEAMDLADRHEILPTLASILYYELNGSAAKVRESVSDREEFEFWGARSAALHARVRHSFKKYGPRWAKALYEYEISLGAMSDLFDDYPDQQEYLTEFLKSKAEYAKISWIHEVSREKNFGQAAESLLDLGLKREQDIWSKKVELSVGKLARLAGKTNSKSNTLIPTDHHLALIKIQDQIYDYVLPSIDNAIDENAEVQLALEVHGNKKLKQQPRFSAFLEESMSRLIKHEAMSSLALIDLLTLMAGGRQSEEDDAFQAEQFYLALRATQYGLTNKDERILVQRIIWRRCMLRDDWKEINNTDLKDDRQVSDQLRSTALYLTFRACLKSRLFEKDSSVQPIKPLVVLGAATDELDHRFTGLDVSIRETIMKDMEIEDNALKPYLDSCQLSKWYQGAFDLAKHDYEEDMAEETNDGEDMTEAEDHLDGIEKKIAQYELRKAESSLKLKPKYKPKATLNGNIGVFRHSIKQY